jgi:ferric-dicitrate binding protein FerR (iron transport regulator)
MSRSREQFEKQVVEPEKYEAWRNNMLVFENTPLSEVADIIEDYYDVKMVIADSLLARRQFTGTLPNNDLEVILLAISTAYKIEIQKNQDQIILK